MSRRLECDTPSFQDERSEPSDAVRAPATRGLPTKRSPRAVEAARHPLHRPRAFEDRRYAATRRLGATRGRAPEHDDAHHIPFGAVRYDGPAYLLLPDGDPNLDLRALCREAADRKGVTRYGAPGQPTLYVTLDPSSAMAEVCHHALNDGRRDPELHIHAMYQLRVRGRFADLHGGERRHPELIGEDYRFTQRLARHVRTTRLHGVLYPSARSNGFCIAAFTASVFRSSRFVDFVSTRVQSDRTIRLCPAGSTRWCLLHRDDLRRSERPVS